MPRNALLKAITKKPMGEARRTLGRAKITDLEINGESAKCNLTFVVDKIERHVPVELKKVHGRWFLFAHPTDFAFSTLGRAFGAHGVIYASSFE